MHYTRHMSLIWRLKCLLQPIVYMFKLQQYFQKNTLLFLKLSRYILVSLKNIIKKCVSTKETITFAFCIFLLGKKERSRHKLDKCLDLNRILINSVHSTTICHIFTQHNNPLGLAHEIRSSDVQLYVITLAMSSKLLLMIAKFNALY